jgi:two-component system C4-dicarboxylate transport sensor histidine kinase DctB|tara:strand:- start:712 stop:2439 length:1728 start_codon:yes stop_codon:yes gene_type:complete
MLKLPRLFPIIAAVAVAVGLFNVSYGYFSSEELSQAEGRLSLYRSTVTDELERFSHLPFVLSRDPIVIQTAQGGSTEVLDTRLAEFAEKAGLDAIYLMDENGLTTSASNAASSGSFVGQNYGFRPYFQTAINGGQGSFYGIGATTGLPGFFIADPVSNAEGVAIGVVAIKIDLTKLEDSWRNSGETVLLANGDGVVLLSSERTWRYRALGPLTAEQRVTIQEARQFSNQVIEPLDWRTDQNGKATIGGVERLHLTSSDLPHGWQLHYFASDQQSLTRSWLVTGSAVFMAAIGFIFYQMQRAGRMGAALNRSEKEEAQLRLSNERLAVEIDERRTAERRLKRTQTELERAGRLAALGKLAASVTHELGQPIAAMRNHLVAAEIAKKVPETLTRNIGGLVDRMDGITKQLKFFAQGRTEEFGTVDMGDAMKTAIALVDPNISESNASLDLVLPKERIRVRGNRLRLEQMMTNVLRNAIDATDGIDNPAIEVSLLEQDDKAVFRIRDNGHGLGEATLAELQEPFFTTQESGKGMGLGLAISMSIVEDHGGIMTARNAAKDGAVFEVTLPMAGKAEDNE